MQVNFSYLSEQFRDIDQYLDDIRNLVSTGDFTLGKAVSEFESLFAKACRMPFAIGVGSGTDALILSLKALGIGPGDEVITATNTFIAMTGAKPVLVDNEDGYVIDHAQIEAAITSQTKAIIPVHYTGNVPDMPYIMDVANKYGLKVVEDACQGIGASLDGNPVGSWGESAAFSLHPLKNLNVWGDGGMIVTRSQEFAERIRLIRNHGLVGRDECVVFGYNSRLDSLQAVIGNRLIPDLGWITAKRIENAERYDSAFHELRDFVRTPHRRTGVRHVYHLYIVRVQRRDELLRHLVAHGIDAKVHYPIPLHLQEASRYLGYKLGDFPLSEADAEQIMTLPAHQHLTNEQIDFVIDQVKEFYN